jgi:hypothetical protein
MTMLDLKADIGIAIFTLFWALAVYSNRKASKRDVLPDPDRSVKREIQITDEMDRRTKRIERQG